MEKLQADVHEKLVDSAETKLKKEDGELSKTAMRKLGLVKRNRKRKPKDDKKKEEEKKKE